MPTSLSPGPPDLSKAKAAAKAAMDKMSLVTDGIFYTKNIAGVVGSVVGGPVRPISPPSSSPLCLSVPISSAY